MEFHNCFDSLGISARVLGLSDKKLQSQMWQFLLFYMLKDVLRSVRRFFPPSNREMRVYFSYEREPVIMQLV